MAAEKKNTFPLLKESLDSQAVIQLAECLREIEPAFNHLGFTKTASSGLDKLELKARVYHVIEALHQQLPKDFQLAAQILSQVKLHQQQTLTLPPFTAWPLIDYVAVYGLEHPETSLKTLAKLTSLFSAEFAIRPFIQQHYELTFKHLHEWCNSSDHHLRRLASEGTRPRLPWGQQLPKFIDNPDPIFPLLEKLKTDPEDYVRRSVANNLNDISKDHPQKVIETSQRWLKDSPCTETQWIVKHATRTLVKKGVPEIFAILGYTTTPQLKIELNLDKQCLVMGEKLNFQIKLTSTTKKTQKLLVDFAIHFMKSNGQQNPKVFKLKALTLEQGESTVLEKSHHFTPLTTRRYYPGQHKIEVKINGQSAAEENFNLAIG